MKRDKRIITNIIFNDLVACENDQIIISKNITNSRIKKMLEFKETIEIRFLINTDMVFKMYTLEEVAKVLIKISKVCKKLNIVIGEYKNHKILTGETYYKEIKELETVLAAISINDENLRNKYLYNVFCDYFDEAFNKEGFCDFKNNKCISNRNPESIYKDMGCCYSFEYSKKITEFICNEKRCIHLENREV